MEENQRKMTPNEYVQEFIFTLNQLRDTPEKLFKEWPIDVILFGEGGIEKPIYTQFAEYFLNNYKISPKDYLDRIKPINRTINYRTDTHNGHHEQAERLVPEKVEALSLFNSVKGAQFPFDVIDYEVPLRATSKDSGIGEIDLLGKRNDTVYLLELKKFDKPNGALLHMILQAYTYFKILNLEKFMKEYACNKVIPSIIFFEDSVNYKQFVDPRNTVFKDLIKHLGMEVFVIKNKNEQYKNEFDIYTFDADRPMLKGDIEIYRFDNKD